jgi:hypothetical protein
LLRAEGVEDYLGAQGIQTWSADFPADDWRHISAARVAELAISRLEAKGKGILLLHDIQPRTVAALPRILHELKARGYRIVHVVPATSDLQKTATEPQQWQLRPVSENVAISRWPAVPSFVFASAEFLPGPSVSESDWRDGALTTLPASFRVRRLARGAVPLPEPAPWPRLSPLPPADGAITLPVPAQSLFEIPERSHAAITATVPLPRHAQRDPGPGSAATDAAPRPIALKLGVAAHPIAGSTPITESGLRRWPITVR